MAGRRSIVGCREHLLSPLSNGGGRVELGEVHSDLHSTAQRGVGRYIVIVLLQNIGGHLLSPLSNGGGRVGLGEVHSNLHSTAQRGVGRDIVSCMHINSGNNLLSPLSNGGRGVGLGEVHSNLHSTAWDGTVSALLLVDVQCGCYCTVQARNWKNYPRIIPT